MKKVWVVILLPLIVASAFYSDSAAKEVRYYAEEEVTRGWEFFNAGKLAEARGRFEQATVIDSSYAQAYYGLAQVYAAQEKFGTAANYFRKTIELADPPIPEAYVNLGFVLILQGNDQEGMQMYNKALSLDPMNKEAHINLAQYYCTQLDGKKAWEHLRFAQKVGAVIPGEQLDDMRSICPEK
jgi:Tfp pilus assembly protein PilF